MNKLGLTLFLVIAICATGLAQRLDQFVQKADTSFANGAYFAAFSYYEAALAYDSTQVRLHFYKGESARFINALDSAINAYEKVILLDSDTLRAFPQALLWKGICEMQRDSLKDARLSLESYLQQDVSVRQRNWDRIATKNLQDLQLKMGPPKGEDTNLGAGINSAYSEVGPRLFDDLLYFTSLRFDGKGQNKKAEPRKSARLMYSRLPEPAQMLQDSFNLQGDNTAYIEFTEEGNRVYYCVCAFILESNDLRCDIFTRSRLDENSSWGPALKLAMNDPEATNTQPAVGVDSLGNAVLYFASDRQGGKGGLDIWYGAIDATTGQVDQAKPFHTMNTAFDDISPFYHAPSRRFFFSSKGYPAFGDFDIYYSILLKDPMRWSEPSQMPPPINSRFADLHYTRDEQSTRSLYASTRPVKEAQRLVDDIGACCHDIYETPILPIDLIVQTWDAKDSFALDSVIVRLYEIQEDGSEIYLEEQFGTLSNTFSFRAERYKSYRVTGARKYYQDAEETLSLLKVPDSVQLIKEDLYLVPRTINLTVKMFDLATSEPLDACNGWWFEGYPMVDNSNLLDHTINPEGKTYFYYTNIELFEPYSFRVSRNGYFPESVEFTFTRKDVDVNTYDITVEVFLERLSSFNMFFDNDYPKYRYPDAIPNPDTTRSDIAELVDAYKSKQGVFETEAQGDTSEITNIRLFFSQLLEANMVDLNTFTSKVSPYLAEGFQVILTLRGYASPLGKQEYNKALTKRRIVSILNYFRQFEQDGVRIADYIDGSNKGQFRVVREAEGEDQTGRSFAEFRARIKKLSKETLEKQSSEAVFSLSASIERRVEITNIRIERKP